MSNDISLSDESQHTNTQDPIVVPAREPRIRSKEATVEALVRLAAPDAARAIEATAAALLRAAVLRHDQRRTDR